MEQRLFELVEALKACHQDIERLGVIDKDPLVLKWLETPSWLRTFCGFLSPSCELIVKSLVATGQDKHLPVEAESEGFRELIEDLLPVQAFYREIGGIVGYHCTMLSLLHAAQQGHVASRGAHHAPAGTDISSENPDTQHYILEGLEALPFFAELYPVGGAADRLGLSLPAAKLTFCGRTLLEGLVRDVQAKEYLYFKRFGLQLITPIAMMTSKEKDNHAHIVDLCEEKNWFDRPSDSIRLFCQPVVPTMDRSGQWLLCGPMKFLMKPGGHGVIWKIAKEEGIFNWMQAQGRTKLLVRQINNPIAGIDGGILAFCGVGFREDKAFGFASCPRLVQSAEGMNILFERQVEGSSQYCLTNVEYCDFLKLGIQDLPEQIESVYSRFPSNTNILFADIARAAHMVSRCPVPGMLVNLKTVTLKDGQEKEMARLESTMQNLADCFESSQVYLTYNARCKTISTVKKLLAPGSSLLETPEGCYYDLLLNAHDLLTRTCGFLMPPMPDKKTYVEQGPSFLFACHPALGPLFSIIGQKMQKGELGEGSELKLEIAELSAHNLVVFGALHITADQVMGAKDERGVLRYSEQTGKCYLHNVTVRNAGINWQASNNYWRDEIERTELCEIQIFGSGEFVACDLTLTGGMRIEVASGVRVIAFEENGVLQFRSEIIQ